MPMEMIRMNIFNRSLHAANADILEQNYRHFGNKDRYLGYLQPQGGTVERDLHKTWLCTTYHFSLLLNHINNGTRWKTWPCARPDNVKIAWLYMFSELKISAENYYSYLQKRNIPQCCNRITMPMKIEPAPGNKHFIRSHMKQKNFGAI